MAEIGGKEGIFQVALKDFITWDTGFTHGFHRMHLRVNVSIVLSV